MADLVPFLILWLMAGFVVGYAAKTNGKDFLPWFIYGYLVLPVALVHLFASTRQRSANRVARNQRSREPWMEPHGAEWDAQRKQRLAAGIDAMKKRLREDRRMRRSQTNMQTKGL